MTTKDLPRFIEGWDGSLGGIDMWQKSNDVVHYTVTPEHITLMTEYIELMKFPHINQARIAEVVEIFRSMVEKNDD